MYSQSRLFRNFQIKSLRMSNFTGFSRSLSIMSRSYEDAINLLNSCQTTHETIKARGKASINHSVKPNEMFKTCFLHLGYAPSDLDRLNIVHVAGTKGKGSTCAYVDSILNHYRKYHKIPIKIGLYTSPHLITVRERIKINSSPISRENFAKYFFEVWDRLEQPLNTKGGPVYLEKPTYFRFLTLMSYHVFLQEEVNVAIYEVGVGGENDCTNIAEHPVVTGISKVGIDHTNSLGNTATEIAWHKAGILKKDCPNYCIDQDPDVLSVINNRAAERKVKFSEIVNTLPQLDNVMIQPSEEFQKQNATLAIYLSNVALKRVAKNYDFTVSDSVSLPAAFVDGLEKAVWKGRCQKIEEEEQIWYIDGAHNRDSIKVATAWLAKELSCELPNVEPKNGLRILVFNQQGRRDPILVLLDLFRESRFNRIQFHHVIFCPTIPEDPEANKELINLSICGKSVKDLTLQKQFAEKWKELDNNKSKVHICQSLEQAIELSRLLSQDSPEKSHIFITGSIHLVGRALGILDGGDL